MMAETAWTSGLSERRSMWLTESLIDLRFCGEVDGKFAVLDVKRKEIRVIGFRQLDFKMMMRKVTIKPDVYRNSSRKSEKVEFKMRFDIQVI